MRIADHSAQPGASGSQHLRRPREPRGDRLPAALQCRRWRAMRRCDHHCRGVDRYGRAYLHGRSGKAAWASPISGTWAGCTTRSAISSMIPIHRPWHWHNDMTFGLLYAFAENFVLPLSRDESGVREALADRQDAWRQLAALCQSAVLPGLHVGAPGQEADLHGLRDRAGERMEPRQRARPGAHSKDPFRRGIQQLVRDLNRLYAHERALHQRDPVSTGFRWVVGDDWHNSVFAFLRYGEESAPPVLIVCNMTPVPRSGYGIGVPRPGRWRELLNTDAASYGGSNIGNGGTVETVPVQRHGEAQSTRTSPCRLWPPCSCARATDLARSHAAPA